MREIYYNSDITPKSANEIKLLALYYDKINIVNDAVYAPKFSQASGKFEFDGVEDFQFIPKTFTTDYKVLIDENIIAITEKNENQEDEFEKGLASKISEIVNANHNLIFPNHPTEKDGKIITEEVYDIMKNMWDFDWGKPVETNLIWWYYSLKLKWFLKLLIEGETCLSSSNNLKALFSAFIQQSTKSNNDLKTQGYTKSLALDALKISLPNPDILSFDDLLELKLRLKDELGLFYQTINAIEVKNKQLYNADLKDNEYQSVFFSEIQKPLIDLENKMKNLNSKTFRKFIEKMQNPKTYVPLIGTVVASMPIHYALLSSLGLTAGMTLLEFKEEKRELEDNGLYFLLKLRN
ncbi:hypothetical protein AM493_09095 [Flavobacterium akiainvivens]|uniref:Uncharacterized protein n=1 Tax=Flavobacterium akiainvivens TaxID=1202724 RepID=A0A0M9VI22_9FLAO|nr:hypothetical protein [Flavobacterium akiainvivens]KOS06169.1 hypothetical protein AM493_09095 [Flavobacterium akiainvivens]SFQ68180.1 hypothetical protein SAMN05444144_11453 [Flavobacterium akiainvivens]